MITVLLGCVFAVALATALLMGLIMWQGAQYDDWVAEFEKQGIKTALEPVFFGSDVVGYTVVRERRANHR